MESAYETPRQRWVRRSVTIPGYALATVVVWAALPLLVCVSALVDLSRRSPWVATRTVLFLAVYLLCESLGIVASGAIWLADRIWPLANRERFERWNFGLQIIWATALLRTGARLFGLRFELEGEEGLESVLERHPVLVFVRHVSTGDTVLPAVFLSGRYGLRLRWVFKRELLWDPCLDIVGQRLPNVFVARGSDDTKREISRVGRLASALAPGEGVLIYPEGTRATPEKRARIIEKLRTSGASDRADRAEGLSHLLPPKLGGPLALLEHCPSANVMILGHTGFEGAVSFREFFRGALVNRVVRIRYWLCSADSIPPDEEARAAWLDDQWARMDEWVSVVGGEAESA